MPFILFIPCSFLDMSLFVAVVDDFVICLPTFAQSFATSSVQLVKKTCCS